MYENGLEPVETNSLVLIDVISFARRSPVYIKCLTLKQKTTVKVTLPLIPSSRNVFVLLLLFPFCKVYWNHLLMSVNKRLRYIVLIFDEWKASMNHGLDRGEGYLSITKRHKLARKYANRCPLAHCLKRLIVLAEDFLTESFYNDIKIYV